MKVQNYQHHVRIVPLFHVLTSAILLCCLAGSAWNLMKAYQHHSGRITAAVLFGLSYAGLMLFWYTRQFGVGVQDRAILAQENLRHFALTGKLLDKRLRKSQVIALRFAPDSEFVPLAEKAANENMNADDIKKAIVNWRPDYHRI